MAPRMNPKFLRLTLKVLCPLTPNDHFSQNHPPSSGHTWQDWSPDWPLAISQMSPGINSFYFLHLKSSLSFHLLLCSFVPVRENNLCSERGRMNSKKQEPELKRGGPCNPALRHWKYKSPELNEFHRESKNFLIRLLSQEQGRQRADLKTDKLSSTSQKFKGNIQLYLT